jgi:ABC-type antimicrobial peptide transport system permease subunit
MYAAEAWRVLFANKVRSLLTVTGLIIGVGAVVAILVLGKSMGGAVNSALGSIADNSFIIFPNTTQRNTQMASIHLSDLAAIKADIPGIVDAQPLGFHTELVHAGHQQARYGVSPDGSIPFNTTPVLYGRRFTDADVTTAAHVCVIDNAVYQRLFPGGGDPTGQNLYVGDRRYVIVGVLQPPHHGFINAQFGADISIPWTTYVQTYVRGSTVFAGRFIAANPSQIPALELAVMNELRQLHGSGAGQQYQTFDKAQITQGINGVFNAITLIVAMIGAVSLVVAGIGVMNIMLVSVVERTREIGVRKAIGARASQILAQFFIEALLLCGAGCSIGLVIGLAIGQAVNQFAIVKLTGSITPIPWLSAVVVAAAFAVVAALAFGTYPAFRASRLDPIEALRYE